MQRAAVMEYEAAVEAIRQSIPGSIVYGWVEVRVAKAMRMLREAGVAVPDDAPMITGDEHVSAGRHRRHRA